MLYELFKVNWETEERDWISAMALPKFSQKAGERIKSKRENKEKEKAGERIEKMLNFGNGIDEIPLPVFPARNSTIFSQ